MDYLNKAFVQFFQFLHGGVATVITSKNISFGVAIILMTALVKIIVLPLNYKSTKSMLKMNEIQPEVQALQAKYKNDPQKSQEQMMKLYKEKGVNPLGGCLPMLIQWPVLIALYYVFNSLNDINGIRFLWISDLGKRDIVLALLAGVTTYVSTLIMSAKNNTPQAKQTATMNIGMSIFMVVMSWNLKSALVLYWVVSNFFQIGQTYLFKKIGTKKSV